MHCKNKTSFELEHHFYSKINDLPDTVIQFLNQQENPYLQPEFLKVQENNNATLNQQYLGVFHNESCIAFAVIQLPDVVLPIPKQFNTNCIITKHIVEKIGLGATRKPFRLMVCGNIFINGQHGHSVSDSSNPQKIVNFITETLIQKARKKNGENIQAILFKDYTDKNSLFPSTLTKKHFQLVKTEPVMLLSLNKKWTTFNDYLMAMKTKYRTKAKKALKESAVLESTFLNAEEIENNLDSFKALYQNVITQSNFSLGKLNLETYTDLKKIFPDKFFMKAYFYEGNPVGFMTAFKNNETLDAHYIGLNYELNKKLYIYQRILYDYVDLAINHNLSAINFGRSATEIKSSIGARALNMSCYIKHRHPVPNTLLGAFINRISPESSHEIMPFK